MINSESILNLFNPVIEYIKNHSTFFLVLIFCILAGYILTLTNQITNSEPTQESINAKLRSVPKPTIETSVTKTILELEDRNTNIQTIFKDARQNPFSE